MLEVTGNHVVTTFDHNEGPRSKTKSPSESTGHEGAVNPDTKPDLCDGEHKSPETNSC